MIGGVIKESIYEKVTCDNNPKVLLVDADSILYMANYGNEDDLLNAKYKVTEIVQDIITTVGECFNIVNTMIFVKGEDNFRYKVDASYKANRKEKHPNIEHLYKYINTEFNTIVANGGEADDYLYTAWTLAQGHTVIAAIDKDIKSFCHGHFYNYKTKVFSFVTPEECIYNFRVQLLIGDTGDGVNKTPGFGVAKAKKVVSKGMSELAFKKEMIKVYRKYHGDNYKQVMSDVYNLLCLHHVNDLNLLNTEYGRN